MNDFRNEFEMMREFDHKNIVKLRGLSLPSARLVMEFIEKGSLFHWLGGKNKQVNQMCIKIHLLITAVWVYKDNLDKIWPKPTLFIFA